MVKPPSPTWKITWRVAVQRLDAVGDAHARAHGGIVERAGDPLPAGLADPVGGPQGDLAGVDDEDGVVRGTVADAAAPPPADGWLVRCTARDLPSRRASRPIRARALPSLAKKRSRSWAPAGRAACVSAGRTEPVIAQRRSAPGGRAPQAPLVDLDRRWPCVGRIFRIGIVAAEHQQQVGFRRPRRTPGLPPIRPTPPIQRGSS